MIRNNIQFALPEAGGLDLLGTDGKTLEDIKLEGVDLKSV